MAPVALVATTPVPVRAAATLGLTVGALGVESANVVPQPRHTTPSPFRKVLADFRIAVVDPERTEVVALGTELTALTP